METEGWSQDVLLWERERKTGRQLFCIQNKMRFTQGKAICGDNPSTAEGGSKRVRAPG